MPAPRWLARLNRRATNRIVRRIAPHLPGFGVVVHTGRKSGRRYRTPVNVFRRQADVVIALTYGGESEWVQNVLESGSCELETRGRRETLNRPRLVRDSERTVVPLLVGLVLRLIRVDEFLVLSKANT